MVMDSHERPVARVARVSRRLRPRPFPIDILVRAPEETRCQLEMATNLSMSSSSGAEHAMNNAYLVWIRKAGEAYHAALPLARLRKKSTPNAVSFHCQQCAEKYLRAFLVQHSRVFPRTRDLLELHKLCLSIDLVVEFIRDLLDDLNPFAVEFRYPGDEVNSDEASAAVHSVEEVRRLIRSKLG